MTPGELLVGGYRMGCRMVELMCEDLTSLSVTRTS
jgi:hypothetical protein